MRTSLNIPLPDELQALRQAIETSNLPQLKTFQQNKRLLNIKDHRGQTPLHWAAEKNVIPEIIDFLLEQSADINAKDNDEKTPLHLATLQGHVAKVSLLIQKGADIACKTNMGVTVFHLAAQYGWLNILDCLLKDKIASEKKELLKDSDNDGKTALHYAAAQGKIEVVEFLLEQGALTNVYDKDHNSSLHLAARYGYDQHVKLLVTAGAQITVKNNMGETPYQISLRFGHIQLAIGLKSQMPQSKLTYEMLLTDPQAIQAITEADSYLMRKQVKEAREKYQLLLSQARQKQDALFEIVCLQKMNEPFLFNKPFSYWEALYPTIASLLQKLEILEIQNKKEEAEQLHSQLLYQAEEVRCLPIQVLCLEKMANAFLSRKNYTTAAKIYNSALALYLQQLPEITLQKATAQLAYNRDVQYFYTKMAEVICSYLKDLNINASDTQGVVANKIIEQRQLLFTMRKRLKEDVANPDKSTSTLLKDISDTTMKLVFNLVEHIKYFLPKSPCDYAIVGFGSLARGEKCTHSDHEYGILIKKDSEKNQRYFRQLAQLLELYIIHLGETSFPICDKGRESPTLSGFCIDSYGISPLGRVDSSTGNKVSSYELIGTPKQLADYQQSKWFLDEPILSTAIRNACLIMGERELLEEYNQKVQQIFVQKTVSSKKSSTAPLLLQEERALALLAEALDVFQPRLDQQKEQEQFFVIKRELYRLLSSVINYLALFYGLRANGFKEQMQALYKANKFNPQGKANLERAMDIVLRLRIRAQLHYGQEYEAIWHPEMSTDKDMPVDHFRLTNADMSAILQVYQTLLPLYQAAKSFCEQNGKTEIFLQQNFYDDRSIAIGDAFQRLGQYNVACEHYQKAIALDAFDFEALSRMGLIWQNLAEFERASTYYERALTALEKKHGQNHPQIAEILNNLGIIKNRLNKPNEAIQLFERALVINQRVFGENSAAAAVNYNNMGLSLSRLDDKQRAKECYEKALSINQGIYGKKHVKIPPNLNNLGAIWNQLANKSKALEYYKEALSLAELVHGAYHPNLTPILHNLGKVLQSLGKAKEAIPHFERAYYIKKTCYGLEHRKMALASSDLGLALLAGKDKNSAIPLLKNAVIISKKTDGENHPSTITYLEDLKNAINSVDPYEQNSEFGSLPLLEGAYPSIENKLSVHTNNKFKQNDPQPKPVVTSDNNFAITDFEYGNMPAIGTSNVISLSPEEVARRNKIIYTEKIQKAFNFDDNDMFTRLRKENHIVYLNNMHLDDEAIPIIIEKLYVNNIQIIFLEGNDITGKGIKLLTDFIKNPDRYKPWRVSQYQSCRFYLKKIDLSRNKIDDEGVQALAEILVLSGTLQSINLQKNNISIAGFSILLDALTKSSLTSVKLCGLEIDVRASRNWTSEESRLKLVQLIETQWGNYTPPTTATPGTSSFWCEWINSSVSLAFALSSLSKQSFFHEGLDREGAQQLLMNQKAGVFLFRRSSVANSICFSCKFNDGTDVHYLLTLQDNNSLLDQEGNHYNNLLEVIVEFKYVFKMPLAVDTASDLQLMQTVNSNIAKDTQTSVPNSPSASGFWQAPPVMEPNKYTTIVKKLAEKYSDLALSVKVILPRLIANRPDSKEVNLCNFKINDNSIAALAEVLLKNTWVETIDISNNPDISDNAIYSLIKLLSENKHIIAINIDGNEQLSEKAKELLQLSLEQNKEFISKTIVLI